MPQTSPINWPILTLLMITSIMFVFSNTNNIINSKSSNKENSYMTTWSWNW